jgi:hypothetical protein
VTRTAFAPARDTINLDPTVTFCKIYTNGKRSDKRRTGTLKNSRDDGVANAWTSKLTQSGQSKTIY